jgi:hypothetical protein
VADALLAKGYQVRVLDSLDATLDGGEANVAISLALSDEERSAVIGQLHSERFADASPAAVYASLLDEGTYRASVSPANDDPCLGQTQRQRS